MASTQNNSIPSSRGNRLEFRTTRDGVVPSSIGALHRLTVDAAMKAALTYAGAKLVIEVDAGGTRVLLADQRTGQLIGGPDDLQKLGSIRTFVNRERKEAAGVEAARETTQLAFLSEKLVKETQPTFEMRPVDSSYGAALRPLQSALTQLGESEKKLSDNTCPNNRDVYEPQVRRLMISIGNAYAKVIFALTQGQSIKSLLSEELFAAGVPDWVHSRFVSKNFVLERTGELSKLFFPTDPSKGLAFSVKEWRSDEFLAKQGPLVQASALAYSLINDDELLRSICGIDRTILLDDEENPLVAKLLKSKLTAMPIDLTASRVRDAGGKMRSGFKFPNPTMDTVSGAITALSTALLRVYSANLQSVDLVGDYYATIAPGAVSRAELTPTNNFYVQWGKAARADAVWIEAIKGGPRDLNLRKKFWRWVRTELRLSEAAGAGKALATALLLQEDGSLPHSGHVDGIIPENDPAGLVLKAPDVDEVAIGALPTWGRTLSRPLLETEIPFWEQFQKRIFAIRVAKKRQAGGLALTPLTPQGKVVLARVKKLSPYVAERMHMWLRSFSDERLQLAAIKVTNAEFDDIFSSSLEEVDDEDTQSQVDWAEAEA